MIRLTSILVIGIVVAISVAMEVRAAGVNDLFNDDLDFVTNVSSSIVGTDLAIRIEEDYGEDNIVPYPPTNGFAIVDNDPNEPVRYFVKIITVTGTEATTVSTVTIEFAITNTGSIHWNDYHFEFWNDNFTGLRTDVVVLQVDPSGTAFPDVTQMPGAVWYDQGAGGAGLAPGQSTDPDFIGFQLPISVFTNVPNLNLGVRQIATIVPLPAPATMGLALFGLLGVGVGVRRWKREKVDRLRVSRSGRI